MNLSNIIITTERLKLVPVSIRYAEIISKEFTPKVTTYMFPKPAETINDTLAFIHMSQEQLIKGESLNVSIFDLQTRELLGGGSINHANTKTPVLGIWIKKGVHGYKYGREAVRGLKEWAEEHLRYEYLTYPVDKRNIPSRKIAESLGGIAGKEYKKINQSGNELEIIEYWLYKSTFDEKNISFRKLTIDDLPLMHKWLNDPYVHEWYDKDKENTLEEITQRYAPKVQGEKPTDCYIILFENKPVGYIQTYKVNDWPEFGDYVGYDDHTASVDLFIGDSTVRGKGFGSIMLKKFLKEIIFSNGDITTCIIGPEPKNIRAIKSYEKTGFHYVKTVQVGNEPDPTYIMEIQKKTY